MKYVLDIIKHEEVFKEERLLLLEIDYELARLYDYLQVKDEVNIVKSKERLKYLHHQLMNVQAKLNDLE